MQNELTQERFQIEPKQQQKCDPKKKYKPEE